MSASNSTPNFATIANTVEIASNARSTWERIGNYGDAGRFLGVSSEVISSHDGIGSVRKIGDGILEVMVGSGIYSYAYAQTVGPMAVFAYHGNVSIEPLGEEGCRLVYTISYDQSAMSEEQRGETATRISGRFKGMAEAMKVEAERAS
jgi:hypothetical protein